MANPILTDLEAAVAEAVTVETSAVTLITGFADRVAAAVSAALANGATAEELAPVTAEVTALRAQSAALAAAVLANTPTAPNPAPSGDGDSTPPAGS